MSQFGFESQALCPAYRAPANDFDTDVSSAAGTAGRPCLVTLESGIQALVQIAGFTYIEGLPLATGVGLAEDVDSADFLERGPDGIKFKSVGSPEVAGPFDSKGHVVFLRSSSQKD